MTLDITTLLVINAANLLLTASTLPFIMGRALSPAAACARGSLVVQAVGWISMILAGLWVHQWPDQLLSTVSVACTSLGQWLMFLALQGWLGPRRGRSLLKWLVIATPIGYGLMFHSYPLRVGWSNLLLATQLLIVSQASLWPHKTLGDAWRWVIFGCTLTMAGFTAARGILGGFFTELYPSFRSAHPVNVMAMLAANVTLVLGNVAVLVAWRQEAEALLEAQAHTDGLTGLLNRHGWEARTPALFDHARRHQKPLAVITLDLDHFKRINDTHGHPVGDQVLALVGEVLRVTCRSSDIAARLGGEEFALLLPDTDLDCALLFEQRLRAGLTHASQLQPDLGVNYSAGLALLHTTDTTLQDYMERADRALYQAKDLGRGRMHIAS